MVRTPSALLPLLLVANACFAQGPVERAGQALDNAGRNVRRGVENAVARGQLNAQERALLNRVSSRLAWDKQLIGSSIQVEVRPDGTAILRGSAVNEITKKRAVDLVVNTVGVTNVVDELAVLKAVKVIQAPAREVIVAPSAAPPREVIVAPSAAPPREVISTPPSSDAAETARP